MEQNNFCPYCGKPLNSGARFCGNCGKKTEPAPIPEPPKVVVPPSPSPAEKPVMEEKVPVAPPLDEQAVSILALFENKNKLRLIIIIIILLVAALVGSIMWLYRPTDEDIYGFEDKWVLVEDKFYDDDGKCSSAEKYSYDEYGNIDTEQLDYGELSLSYKYYYDELGNKCSCDFYDGSSQEQIIWQYDANNKCIEEKQLNNEEQVIYTTSYSYDDNGNLIQYSHIYTRNDGETEQYDHYYEYDQHNNVISETAYSVGNDSDSTCWTTYQYVYNNDNQIIEKCVQEKYSFGTEENKKYVYTYDSQGRMLTETTYSIIEDEPDYTKMWIYSYFYDENGNEVAKYAERNASSNFESIPYHLSEEKTYECLRFQLINGEVVSCKVIDTSTYNPT